MVLTGIFAFVAPYLWCSIIMQTSANVVARQPLQKKVNVPYALIFSTCSSLIDWMFPKNHRLHLTCDGSQFRAYQQFSRLTGYRYHLNRSCWRVQEFCTFDGLLHGNPEIDLLSQYRFASCTEDHQRVSNRWLENMRGKLLLMLIYLRILH